MGSSCLTCGAHSTFLSAWVSSLMAPAQTPTLLAADTCLMHFKQIILTRRSHSFVRFSAQLPYSGQTTGFPAAGTMDFLPRPLKKPHFIFDDFFLALAFFFFSGAASNSIPKRLERSVDLSPFAGFVLRVTAVAVPAALISSEWSTFLS
jgi:hypothetical protein